MIDHIQDIDNYNYEGRIDASLLTMMALGSLAPILGAVIIPMTIKAIFEKENLQEQEKLLEALK